MDNIVIDTSALLAYFDSSEPDHDRVDELISTSTGLLIVSPYVVAETDYLVATRHGVGPQLAVLDELSGGAWELPGLDAQDLRLARAVIAKFGDQQIGVADASSVVLADRYQTRLMATLDRRHFGVLRTLRGDRFEILP